MKINVAFPATGCQKLFEIHDELKVILEWDMDLDSLKVMSIFESLLTTFEVTI